MAQSNEEIYIDALQELILTEPNEVIAVMEEDSEILQHIEDVIKVVQKKIDTFDRRLD